MSKQQPVAYSYRRFSTPKQEAGDSIRRQTELAEAWAKRHGVPLDKSLEIDKGVSAFKGKNADVGSLSVFLEMVKGGTVRKGSFLAVESLDRLTRNEIVAAVHLVTGILIAGVKIVQLSPVEMIYTDKSQVHEVMLLIVELMRSNGESKVKSERVTESWKKRHKQVTEILPGWLRREGGKAVVIPERVAVIRKIFQWAADDCGLREIVKRLTEGGYPPMGRSRKWNKGFLTSLFTGRLVLGEYQPKVRGEGKRVPNGEPDAEKYPAVIDEELYERARVKLLSRKHPVGRPAADRVNLFTGLVKNPRHGDNYIMVVRKDGSGRRVPVLLPSSADQGRAAGVSFPLATFEKAVLGCLREVKPSEILPFQGEGEDDVPIFRAELEKIEARIAKLESDLDKDEDDKDMVDWVKSQVRKQLTLKREVTAKLDGALSERANPLSEAWGKVTPLLDALQSAPDQEEARTRLRLALSRVIDSIWLLPTGRGKGRCRYAMVQIRFRRTGWEDLVRCIHIFHQPPLGGRAGKKPGLWWAKSYRSWVPETMPQIDLSRMTAADAEREAGQLPDWIDHAMHHYFMEDGGPGSNTVIYGEIQPD